MFDVDSSHIRHAVGHSCLSSAAAAAVTSSQLRFNSLRSFVLQVSIFMIFTVVSSESLVCGGFAAECRAGRRYRSTAAAELAPLLLHGTQQQIALSSKCEQ